MRRLVAFGLITAALLGSACATSTQRPEGVVERWLNSLNQGSAGDPGAYASNEVSQQVVPDWAGLDPGELDVIEVGRAVANGSDATSSGPMGGVATIVPFRIVRTSGVTFRGVAKVGQTGSGPRIFDVETAEGYGSFKLPSEGGPRVEAVAPFAWLGALAIAGLCILGAVGLMAIARRKPATA